MVCLGTSTSQVDVSRESVCLRVYFRERCLVLRHLTVGDLLSGSVLENIRSRFSVVYWIQFSAFSWAINSLTSWFIVCLQVTHHILGFKLDPRSIRWYKMDTECVSLSLPQVKCKGTYLHTHWWLYLFLLYYFRFLK